MCPAQAGDGPAVPSACLPSMATNAPAGLRAIQTVKKLNLYPAPLHREKTEASPLAHERNSQVLFPARLEEGFLGQPREQVRGWWGAEPGENPLKSYCVLSPPREGRSEAASIGNFYRVGALKVWVPDLLRCIIWELVRDTSPRAPPHTCRIRTSGVGHSMLGFTKDPPQGIWRQARDAECLDQACRESEPCCGRRGLGPGDFRAAPPICPGSVQFSRSVVSNSLQPHESQHARPPCPSSAPEVYPNSCPSSC